MKDERTGNQLVRLPFWGGLIIPQRAGQLDPAVEALRQRQHPGPQRLYRPGWPGYDQHDLAAERRALHHPVQRRRSEHPVVYPAWLRLGDLR